MVYHGYIVPASRHDRDNAGIHASIQYSDRRSRLLVRKLCSLRDTELCLLGFCASVSEASAYCDIHLPFFQLFVYFVACNRYSASGKPHPLATEMRKCSRQTEQLTGGMNTCWCQTAHFAYPHFGGYMTFENTKELRDLFNVVKYWAPAAGIGLAIPVASFFGAVIWWFKCRRMWTVSKTRRTDYELRDMAIDWTWLTFSPAL